MSYIPAQRLKPGDRLPSERAFAELFKVRRPIVNKALACLISEGRLRREGYKLYVASPTVIFSETKPIGILCPHPLHRNNVVSHNLVEAAHDVCKTSKMSFIPMLSTDGQEQRAQLIDLLRQMPAGIVIWPHAEEHYLDLFKQCVSRKIPLVINGAELAPFDCVGVDNYRGIEQTVRHLIDLGHRHIAYFTRRMTMDYLIERHDGFRYAVHKHLAQDPRRDVYELPGDSNEGLADLFDKFLQQKQRPTALCCSQDVLALQILRLAAERGISVPDELSITGFDGIDSGANSQPSLTTVAQDFYQLGVLAVELVIRRIRLKQITSDDLPLHVHLAPSLLNRNSTSRAPASPSKSRSH